MKSAVCYELGKPLVIDAIAIDAPERSEVKVRLVATGICHSDISLLKGEWGPVPCPLVAGHEGGGIVEEVGEGVTYLKPGDYVVVSPLRSCKQCVYCTTGRPYLCRGFPLFRHTDICIPQPVES
jgi:Zn-dependent alcohol dehydrogenase